MSSSLGVQHALQVNPLGVKKVEIIKTILLLWNIFLHLYLEGKMEGRETTYIAQI